MKRIYLTGDLILLLRKTLPIAIAFSQILCLRTLPLRPNYFEVFKLTVM